VTEYGNYLESFEPGEATTTSGFQLRLVYFWNSSITVFSTIRFRGPKNYMRYPVSFMVLCYQGVVFGANLNNWLNGTLTTPARLPLWFYQGRSLVEGHRHILVALSRYDCSSTLSALVSLYLSRLLWETLHIFGLSQRQVQLGQCFSTTTIEELNVSMFYQDPVCLFSAYLSLVFLTKLRLFCTFWSSMF
jgi:hypothetical protein